MSDSPHLVSTLPPPPASVSSALEPFALTVLCHPDWARLGEVAVLPRFADGEVLELSRLTPLFVDPHAPNSTNPLADPFLSRSPMTLQWKDQRVHLTPRAEVELSVQGQRVTGPTNVAFPPGGLVLMLGRKVLLLLHRHPGRWRKEREGLIGQSAHLQRLVDDVERVALAHGPVLVRGETGTGKELIARALHELGPRAGKPFVAVNLAAVTSSVAASELFGHSSGAFTGANRTHGGYFGEADGGTLFLDEVGELSIEVQAMLLRVLESGEVQPVGAQRPHRVDVRVVAATDSDLESGIADGDFRPALYHRLAAFQLHSPSLRERLDDLGRLVRHFATTTAALLTAPAMERLALARWSGNLRELRNIVGQLELSQQRTGAPIDDHPALPALPSPESAAASVGGDARSIDDGRLIEALRANQWRLAPTARALGISRTTLYSRIDASPLLRKAGDVPDDELRSVWAACEGNAEEAARRLEVSARALSVRARALGLTP